MVEYIEREAAIKRFNFAVLDCLGMEPTIRAGDIIKALESIPAADVRPVVFCKNCVHFVRGELLGDMVCDYHYLHQYHAEPYDFCSHAEKREDS